MIDEKKTNGTDIDEKEVTTVIADDLEIQGTIKFKSTVMLKGVFEGEILSEGLLVVGPAAKVTATITTKTLISHGEIVGNATANERVILLKGTATHNGDLKAPSITIESGAECNGSAIMERKLAVEESVETQGKEPLSAREPAAYEPAVTPVMVEKPGPFTVERYDQRNKQMKDKITSEEPEDDEKKWIPLKTPECKTQKGSGNYSYEDAGKNFSLAS